MCMSYHTGLLLTRDNLVGRKSSAFGFSQLKHKFSKSRRDGEQLPFILLPEWSLPIEVLHPDLSVLALVTDLHPFPYPSPVTVDADMSGSVEGQHGESTKTVSKLLVSCHIAN